MAFLTASGGLCIAMGHALVLHVEIVRNGLEARWWWTLHQLGSGLALLATLLATRSRTQSLRGRAYWAVLLQGVPQFGRGIIILCGLYAGFRIVEYLTFGNPETKCVLTYSEQVVFSSYWCGAYAVAAGAAFALAESASHSQ